MGAWTNTTITKVEFQHDFKDFCSNGSPDITLKNTKIRSRKKMYAMTSKLPVFIAYKNSNPIAHAHDSQVEINYHLFKIT